MAAKNQKLKKKQRIRNNEYYDAQTTFDELYSKAKENYNFTNLMEIITSKENILLAFRNIKKNKGSKTSGVNKTNIINVGQQEPEKLIQYVTGRLSDFKPHSVRRVEIEKDNGKLRPLGIPTIEDRLIQQCIKQVLEPICEAKFHKHSYGFRPNRSTHHAIARAMYLTNLKNFQYVVDIDIKGFFDNVNHGKLLKQIWTLGVRDKNLISIISKMLKAEIKGIGIPRCGVPQGGILSVLLSNIVLNELDWWISSQWETHKPHNKYSCVGSMQLQLKKSKLKEVFIVRYCDDFKLFCKNRKDAECMFSATKSWLQERLGLEISPEKSKIVNLKKKYSEFLGIKMKLWKKGDKNVIRSHMTDKAMRKCKEKLKGKAKNIAAVTTVENVQVYNASVLGMHNYYKVATHIYKDFSKIAFIVNKSLKCRMKYRKSKNGRKSKAFIKFYGDYGGKIIYAHNVALFPIDGITMKPPRCFSQDVCNYTVNGRLKVHNNLQNIDINILKYLMQNSVKGESTEFNDNRISLYVGQKGICFVSGEILETTDMEAHHTVPRLQGGTDEYKNLVFVTYNVHKLIHSSKPETIEKYLNKIKSTKINFERLNKLRNLVGNCEVIVNK